MYLIIINIIIWICRQINMILIRQSFIYKLYICNLFYKLSNSILYIYIYIYSYDKL